jgi:hypothetical protein
MIQPSDLKLNAREYAEHWARVNGVNLEIREAGDALSRRVEVIYTDRNGNDWGCQFTMHKEVEGHFKSTIQDRLYDLVFKHRPPRLSAPVSSAPVVVGAA